MNRNALHTPKLRAAARAGAVGLVALGLAACNSTFSQGGGKDLSGGIDYRQKRFEETSALQDFRDCRKEAMALSDKARANSAPGRYLASARLLEKCEAEVPPEAADRARDERMRAYALSIQNYFKGGNVEKAAANLKDFKEAFPDKDLYFKDGSSFIATMEVLLGQRPDSDLGRFSTANVNETLKAEMKRIRYWNNN